MKTKSQIFIDYELVFTCWEGSARARRSASRKSCVFGDISLQTDSQTHSRGHVRAAAYINLTSSRTEWSHHLFSCRPTRVTNKKGFFPFDARTHKLIKHIFLLYIPEANKTMWTLYENTISLTMPLEMFLPVEWAERGWGGAAAGRVAFLETSRSRLILRQIILI